MPRRRGFAFDGSFDSLNPKNDAERYEYDEDGVSNQLHGATCSKVQRLGRLMKSGTFQRTGC
ncbi:hypothetical protein [Stieleria varia]|uniref:hypothetical protein n=1 Tax=Stieleria varia TaxID=2528005 RepID=UPI0011B83CF2|nr:hypothetical protein [Stieleria varia]